jgi:small-conductance mechanosensitive channel
VSQEWDLAEANNQSRAERPPEESMTAELSELAKLSSQLNSASENVNSVITRVNDALASMNLGVQTWLKNYLWVGEYFTPTLPMVNTARTTVADILRHEEIKDEARRDSPDLKRSRKAVQLGYARAENTFQLAVRSVTIEEFVNPAGEFAERIVNLSR